MEVKEGFMADSRFEKSTGDKIKDFFISFFPIEHHERTKLLLLTISFFLIIGAYTVAKELKDIVFTEIVGKNYMPIAKTITIILLIPSILIYSKFVDTLRRYQLLALYTFVFGAIGIIFSILLGHPTIGLPNTDANSNRLFGWIFYFFIESYTPFVVSVFWAFANSINSPESAKKGYALMVSGSKLGGMLTAALAYVILSIKSTAVLSDTLRYQILLGGASFLLLLVPLVIFALVKYVSSRYLHGYEAVYQVEKQRIKSGESETGLFSGLMMLIKYPYAFGIFCIVLFYEIIQTILNYQRLGIAKESAATVSEFGASLFAIIFFVHFIGFIISMTGTKILLEKLGEKLCLLLVPFTTALLFLFFCVIGTPFAFMVFLVGIRSIHYAFSYPVRESLYILTVRDIKFKSKSWIDAFGSKFAKSTGSMFNFMTEGLSFPLFFTAQIFLFSGIIGVWVVVAYLLGTRFEKAVARNEVIGMDQQ